MKRWLIWIFVFFVVVLLIAPRIIGHIAERQLPLIAEQMNAQNSDIRVSNLLHQRNWFNSQERYRLEFANGVYPELRQLYRNFARQDELKALIINTQIEHGLLPLHALKPGLVSANSTLELETLSGDLLPLPITVQTHISLNGKQQSKVQIAAGHLDGPTHDMQWGDSEFVIDSNPQGLMTMISGDISTFKIELSQGVLQTDKLHFAYQQQASKKQEPVLIPAGSLQLKMPGHVDDTLLRAHLPFITQDISATGRIAFDLQLELTACGWHTRELRQLLQRLQTQNKPPASMSGGQYLLSLSADLLSKGGQLDLSTFRLSLPQGTTDVTANVSVLETDYSTTTDFPAALLLQSSANFKAQVPRVLIQQLLAMQPESIRPLIAFGFLRPSAEVYTIQVDYKEGEATINGAPYSVTNFL